jgi:hypothetical protein
VIGAYKRGMKLLSKILIENDRNKKKKKKEEEL